MSSHVLCLDTLLTFIAQMMDRVENQVNSTKSYNVQFFLLMNISFEIE